MSDLLVAESRRRFDEMRNRRLAEEDDRPEGDPFAADQIFSGSTSEEAAAQRPLHERGVLMAGVDTRPHVLKLESKSAPLFWSQGGI